MHLAAASGLRETLMLLYDHGGDLFKRDFDGMLPFHHALLMDSFYCNVYNKS